MKVRQAYNKSKADYAPAAVEEFEKRIKLNPL